MVLGLNGWLGDAILLLAFPRYKSIAKKQTSSDNGFSNQHHSRLVIGLKN
jgi:hypothetical protein